jgi:hypothetical protein
MPTLPTNKETLFQKAPTHWSGQKTLHEWLLSPSSSTHSEDVWGHTPETIDASTTFWVMLQKPRGLKLFTSPLELLFSLFTCKDMGIGALCIPETNINWGIKDSHSKWFGLMRKVWQHSLYITSHTQEEFKGVHQPGGTLTFLANNWTLRIIDKGSDPFGLGRWSYMTLRGSREKWIILVTAYRVCVESIQSCGDTTSTAQQFRELSKIWRQQEALDVDPVPRRQFILDL